jgi:hypothetical protein
MPTIPQLPLTNVVFSSDVLPISQGGSVHAASVGTLLLSAQPVITVQSPSLLGRTSLGSGGPEQIDVGIGMDLSGGTVVANGADHATYPSTPSLSLGSDLVISNQGSQMLMPTEFLRGLFSAGQNVSIDTDGVISATASGSTAETTVIGSPIGSLQILPLVTAQDLVPISHLGNDCAASYSNFLNGITIDEAQSASATADSDLIWVAQSTNIMGSQSFSAIWTWISGKIPAYKPPVVEITTSTNLTTAVHNGRVLLCSQPVTLTPSPANMGNGFQCQVVNASSGNVTLGVGFLTSTGGSIIGPQQAVTIQCLTYSAGTIVYASMPPPAAQASTAAQVSTAAPGQVIQLAASSISTGTVGISWQLPIGGGAPSSYVVQYRLSGSGNWIISSAAVSGTNYQISGLSPNTSYDITVAAVNGSGTGSASQILTVSTTVAAGQSVPNQATGLLTLSISTSSIALSWSGQTGTNAPATYTVQYRTTGSASWASLIPGVSTTSYTVSGLQSATSYDFSVYGVNSAGAGAASIVVSATTTSTGNAVSSIVWNLAPSGTYSVANGTIGVNAHVSPSSAAIQFGFSNSSAAPPTSWTAGLHVNTDLWGAYVATPSAPGNWYAWVEGTDGSSPTQFATPFVVQ